MRTCLTQGLQGSWCSGITPAQHAGGPGFNPQCAHVLMLCCLPALAGGHLKGSIAGAPGTPAIDCWGARRLPGCPTPRQSIAGVPGPAPRQSTDSTEVILCSTLSSAGVEPCSAGAALCCAGAVLCSTNTL